MNEKKKIHVIAYRTYILVWLALVFLTGIAVMLASLDLGDFNIGVALIIASFKAVLILYFFMHLKYERKFFQLMLLLAILTLTVIIGMTFFDLEFRY